MLTFFQSKAVLSSMFGGLHAQWLPLLTVLVTGLKVLLLTKAQ